MIMTERCFLYVEDDPLSCEVMQLMLGGLMGIKKLHIFRDSADFLERMAALTCVPDVIMLDIQVEPFDGFAMLNMLKQDTRFAHARVIALTASVMNEEVERLRTSGFHGAIAKPLSAQTFPELMRRVMRGDSVWHIA